MAKAKTCAYHLCGQPLPLDDDPRSRYCELRCYNNAKLWRWRHRKPAKRASQQHRWWKRKQRDNIKKTYAARRRPLATRVAKKVIEDTRESQAEQVA